MRCAGGSAGASQRSPNGAKEHRHAPMETLNAKLRGHYQYYGRPTNSQSLLKFYRGVVRIWRKWLNRRTRGNRMTWERYKQLLRRYPCCHLRFDIPGRTRRVLLEEPAAGNLHGGVCEGGDPGGAMVDLNGHEAGNGGHSQGKPPAYRDSSTRREAMLRQQPKVTSWTRLFSF